MMGGLDYGEAVGGRRNWKGLDRSQKEREWGGELALEFLYAGWRQ